MRVKPWPAVFWRWAKRGAPRSLFGRTLLIIVLPIALMQMAASYAFFDAHWRGVNARLADSFAGKAAYLAESLEADPAPAHFAIIRDRAQAAFGLKLAWTGPQALPAQAPTPWWSQARPALERALHRRLGRPFWYTLHDRTQTVEARIPLTTGVLAIIAPQERVFATRGLSFLLWIALVTVVLTATAVIFIRNQVRAIERLARAAEAFGKGLDPAFRPHGAREVRQAATAFLAMKERIQRHVEQRTALLASVSHDLRTPLTRLKLELALAEPSALTEAMRQDLADMEAMIDEYLDFARGQGGEAPRLLTLATVLADAARGLECERLSVTVDPGLTFRGREAALRRAFANLIGNALDHARRVEVTAVRSGRNLIVTIDDDGPGIPAERIEEAFSPFTRLDASRNQNTKGVGLGLAIARDVVRGHGGEITLETSPHGGLRACVSLPA
jgi:two-component system, OmpR family, osmolarity sensor histidine kinase EnvZ